ncbi:uncharacterized protein LOC131228494 [Magnolia sinica]|uniref:uncharacterized protein LOC131228494 n=1 Tax=Magnolia sinica TaxID=86752 RepID=UPI00265A577D|nr:uncharacterized protein LOC131228494 [Magnolia sinica]
MGKVEVDQVIHHFSHQHPLSLSNLPQQTPNTQPSCSGCTLKASGWMYTCKTCNYSLHISCSKMPPMINHPSHVAHPLTLFSSPIYPEGVFTCNACGKQGAGFCYHCKVCELDIHILCAAMKLSVTHEAHHHTLNLEFSPPYHNKSFSCDICKRTGSNHWLYRCNICEFDAHMSCGVAKSKSGGCTQFQQQQQQQQQLQVGFSNGSRSINQVNHYVQQQPLQLQQQQQQQLQFGSSNGSGSISQVNHYVQQQPLQQLLQQQLLLQQLLQQHQQLQLPYVPPQFPVPETGFTTGSQYINQPSHCVSGPRFGATGHVQPSGSTGLASNLMQHAIQGFVDGLSQQGGQSNMMQGLLGDPSSSSGLDIGSTILSSVIGFNN